MSDEKAVTLNRWYFIRPVKLDDITGAGLHVVRHLNQNSMYGYVVVAPEKSEAIEGDKVVYNKIGQEIDYNGETLIVVGENNVLALVEE